MPSRGLGAGNRRIDAAIDHFVDKGYAVRRIRAVIADLHKVYGGPSPEVWQVLEDGRYKLVQDRLFELEEQEKQQQDAELLLEFQQQQDGQGQQVEDEPPQHQEPAADEEVEDLMFVEPPAREAVLPLNAARMIGPRRASYYGWGGWLSASEDEEEEQPTGQKHEVHVLSPGERGQYIDDQAAEMAPENTEYAVAEAGESMTEETEDRNIQAGRRARPPRQKKANVRLAGPEWAK